MATFAPFTDEQIASLSERQGCGRLHEYTCPNNHKSRVLVPKRHGLFCSVCDYTQNWVHDGDANWGWKRVVQPLPWDKEHTP